MKISVAVVESNRDIRKAHEEIIRMNSKFDLVCSCESGEDTLIKLLIYLPHVVLMNIHLSGINGI